jgi:hypothetical protein
VSCLDFVVKSSGAAVYAQPRPASFTILQAFASSPLAQLQ